MKSSPLATLGTLALALAILLPATSRAEGRGRLLDHVVFGGSAAAASEAIRPISFTWQIGDRTMPLQGVMLPGPGARFGFTLSRRFGENLTLELREFRTDDGQSPAYVVFVADEPIAFRCRRYHGTGPASAFIDLPGTKARRLKVIVENRSRAPESS